MVAPNFFGNINASRLATLLPKSNGQNYYRAFLVIATVSCVAAACRAQNGGASRVCFGLLSAGLAYHGLNNEYNNLLNSAKLPSPGKK